jgi:hypothetical protein
MDPRVTTAWRLLEEELEEYDSFYLTHTNERTGDYVRAWSLLEEAWREGITLDEVIESVNLDAISLESDAERVLWLSDLMGTLGDTLVLDYISPVLDAIVHRSSMRTLDVSDYFGNYQGRPDNHGKLEVAYQRPSIAHARCWVVRTSPNSSNSHLTTSPC